MRALGYTRLSKWDDNTTSIKRQTDAIEALCEARGWELVDVLEDVDVSGFNGEGGPGLDRLRSRLGEVGAVVVYRIDRLARSSKRFRALLEEFEAAGVQFVMTDMDVADTADGRLIRDLTARLAEAESDRLSERMKAVSAALKKEGRHVGGIPYGWRLPVELDADGNPKRDRTGKPIRSTVLVPEPQEQETLRQIATRYVGGESLRRIAPDFGFTHANLSRVLRSQRVLDALGELGQRLAVELSERGRTGTKATPSLLGGILRCSVCDQTMTVFGMSTRKGRRPRGSYGCRSAHVYITRERADEIVTQQVLAAIDTDRLARRMAKRKRPRNRLEVDALRARLGDLERAHYVTGRVPRERFEPLHAELSERIAKAEQQLQDDAGPDFPLELARRLKTPRVWGALSVAERRQIVKALVRTIVVAKANDHGPVDSSRLNILWR